MTVEVGVTMPKPLLFSQVHEAVKKMLPAHMAKEKAKHEAALAAARARKGKKSNGEETSVQ